MIFTYFLGYDVPKKLFLPTNAFSTCTENLFYLDRQFASIYMYIQSKAKEFGPFEENLFTVRVFIFSPPNWEEICELLQQLAEC